MVENGIPLKSGITICVDVSIKIQEGIVYAEKITLGILASKLVRLMNI